MSATKERKPREKKLEQQFIPGTEPPRVPAVDGAAKIYFDVMQQRCELSKEEDEAKDNLIDKMKEAGLTIYETKHGLIVTVTEKSNVKCKKKGAETNGDDE